MRTSLVSDRSVACPLGDVDGVAQSPSEPSVERSAVPQPRWQTADRTSATISDAYGPCLPSEHLIPVCSCCGADEPCDGETVQARVFRPMVALGVDRPPALGTPEDWQRILREAGAL